MKANCPSCQAEIEIENGRVDISGFSIPFRTLFAFGLKVGFMAMLVFSIFLWLALFALWIGGYIGAVAFKVWQMI